MKILFVTMSPLELNTSATIRNKGLIKGLSKLGHSIDCMTLRPKKDSINYDPTMNDIENFIEKIYYIENSFIYNKFMAKKNNTKVNIKSKNTFKNKTYKMIRKNIKKIYDNISIYDAQKYNIKEISNVKIDYFKYDIIISSSDPKSSHLIPKKIYKENKNFNAKWIQYWGDPMLIDIMRKNDYRDFLIKKEENKLLSKADSVVYASPLTLKEQKRIYNKFSQKMYYANQSYANLSNINYNKCDINISLGYFGSYKSTTRNITPLYEAVNETDVKLFIHGSSDIELKITKNVVVGGPIPYAEVMEKEQKLDILVCICNIRGTQIPGKIYYSTGYNKPIIVIVDGEYEDELIDYFGKFNRFIICKNNKSSIKDSIHKAIDLLGKKTYMPKEVTPEYMAKKIINTIEI